MVGGIVAKMQPKAPWSREAWNTAMTSLGLAKEEWPCYNKCALWVEMNKQYTDHAETIANVVLKKAVSLVPSEQMVRACHALAVDVLKDADGVYDIRSYFGV